MQTLTLANGVQVFLHHDPAASRAAALIQLAAGSHDAPPAWPGLAHLLEHLVFAGSIDYPDDERLMAWAQSQSARLNATTSDTSIAWFFDVSADLLEAGLARMVDMLARPLLTEQAVRQEVAVIDAEYQLLASDSDTLCEAATRTAFTSPAALQAFHVGSAQSFGADTAALQQALRDYHQRYFTGGNLRLWLQGPQSLTELAALAENYAGHFAAGGEPAASAPALQLQTARYLTLRLAGTARLRLSFCLSRGSRAALSLLREFLRDEAPGSLLAELRKRDFADGVQLLLPYCSCNGTILSIEFMLTAADAPRFAAVESLFFSWLQQLVHITPQQIQHYTRLALRQFARQSPVDQLRARAFAFTPPENDISADWQQLLTQLGVENLTRLAVSADVAAEDCQSQGFILPLDPLHWPQLACPQPDWLFYPLSAPLSAPSLPSSSLPLPHRECGSGQGVLLLSPACGYALAETCGLTLQACLRALMAECAHFGGMLRVEREQGSWLIQLSGENALMLAMLNRLLQQISEISTASIAQGERQYQQLQQKWQSDIAVRSLLNQLPLIINGKQPADWTQIPWQAALYGGDAELQQQLSRLLTRFPAAINRPHPLPAMPQPARAQYCLPVSGADAALLLFCPLVEPSAECLAAWKILAALFEPRFFQQLRTEKNIGYVVSCRFQQVSGIHGLLFAVQSPICTVEAIVAHIEQFLQQMAPIVSELALFDIQRDRLCASLAERHQDRLPQCRELWLVQQSFAPELSKQAISRLTQPRLHKFYQQLRRQKQRWWLIAGLPRSPA